VLAGKTGSFLQVIARTVLAAQSQRLMRTN
jgi:hypothetical protein